MKQTELAVLCVLGVQPMTGYAVRAAIREQLGFFWSESFGQIYPALRRLAEAGLIEQSATPSEGGRRRHVYAINAAGRAALAAWLRQPAELPQVRIELMLKLFFGSRCDRATNRAQILAYREQMVNDLERYRSITERLHRERAAAADLPYWLLTLRFGERDRIAHIEWCDEALTVLEGLPESESETRSEANPDLAEVQTEGSSR